MKNRRPLTLLALAVLAIAPPSFASQDQPSVHKSGKTTATNVPRDVENAAETIKDYTADKRDEAAKNAKAALDALDARIEAMEARIDKNWDKMDKTTREHARNTLDALRKQRLQAAEWYGGLKNSSVAAWEHMKKGFSDAYNSLRRASEKAERDYGTDDHKK